MKRLAEITGGRVLSWDNPAEVFDRQAASRMRSMIGVIRRWRRPCAVGRRHRRAAPGSAMGRHRRWPPCSAGGLPAGRA